MQYNVNLEENKFRKSEKLCKTTTACEKEALPVPTN
jgi:hypothetical protein